MMMRNNESSPKMKIHSIQAYFKKQEKISNTLILHLKELQNKNKNNNNIKPKPEVRRIKEIIKIRAKLSKIDSKKNTKDQ